MEMRNKSVKRVDGKKAEKPKQAHSKKAPLIAGLVAATALAVGACTAKDEKPVENKKGELVTEDKAEKPKTKKIEVFMSEVEVPEENVVEEKPKTKTVEVFMSEVDVPMETKAMTKTVKENDILPLATSTSESAWAMFLKVTKVDSKGVEVVLENEVFMSDTTSEPMRVDYGKSLKTGEAAISVEIKAEKGEKAGEAALTVKMTVPKGIEAEVLTDKDVIEMKTVTKTVKEGDEIPAMSMGPDFGHMQSAEVVKINEEGVEVSWKIETAFEEGYMDYSVKVPFGESRKVGEGALTWEVKAEKGKNPGEAVVTVKYPDFSE